MHLRKTLKRSRRPPGLSLVVNDRSVKVITIGYRRSCANRQGKCVLALAKLNRNVPGYHLPVGSNPVAEALCRPDVLTVELDCDSNHLVRNLRPNRAVDFQIHGLVAGGVEVDRYR